jgi:hypothetical protein
MFDFSMSKHDASWKLVPNTSDARRFVAEHREISMPGGALEVPLKKWLHVARELSAQGLAVELVSRHRM